MCCNKPTHKVECIVWSVNDISLHYTEQHHDIIEGALANIPPAPIILNASICNIASGRDSNVYLHVIQMPEVTYPINNFFLVQILCGRKMLSAGVYKHPQNLWTPWTAFKWNFPNQEVMQCLI